MRELDFAGVKTLMSGPDGRPGSPPYTTEVCRITMCGLYGYIGRNFLQVNPCVVLLLRHRDPVANGVYLGHNFRLVLGIPPTQFSIIDLSAKANQPMVMSRDHTFWAVRRLTWN